MNLAFGCLSFLQSEVGGSGYHYSTPLVLLCLSKFMPVNLFKQPNMFMIIDHTFVSDSFKILCFQEFGTKTSCFRSMQGLPLLSLLYPLKNNQRQGSQ